jgi:hypothetical protein
VTPLESIDTQLRDACKRRKVAIWADDWAAMAACDVEIDGLLALWSRTARPVPVR